MIIVFTLNRQKILMSIKTIRENNDVLEFSNGLHAFGVYCRLQNVGMIGVDSFEDGSATPQHDTPRRATP